MSDFEKPEMIEIYCDCTEGKKMPVYAFTNTIEEEFSTICRFCQKQIYNVTCESAKCGSGYSLPSSAKELNEIEGTWKCPDCNKLNSLSSAKTNQLATYLKTDIPEDVFKKRYGGDSIFGGKLHPIKIFIIFILSFGFIISITGLVDTLFDSLFP